LLIPHFEQTLLILRNKEQDTPACTAIQPIPCLSVFAYTVHVSTALALALHTKQLISLLLSPRPHLHSASHHRTVLMRHLIQCHVRATEENLGSVSVDVGVLTGLLL